jgi:hypothetical protein
LSVVVVCGWLDWLAVVVSIGGSNELVVVVVVVSIGWFNELVVIVARCILVTIVVVVVA